ncbi:MAG: hypothetical protein V3V30_01270 [Parvularculaceae bacterium]
MDSQNRDRLEKKGEKQAWTKPQLVDMDEALDSVENVAGPTTDAFGPTS